MKSQDDVAHQMERIKGCFLRAQQISVLSDDLPKLITHLENTDSEFRSVAYEGASMELALKDLSQGETLRHWRSLLEGPGVNHAAQIHVGLGWALSQQQVSLSTLAETFHPLLEHRILDGAGYYDGVFRSRMAITSHLRPDPIPGKYFQAYDIGLGRSLWYRYQGDLTKIIDLIFGFSAERHANLWLGIGIACTYVGGFTESLIKELSIHASNHRFQLATGAALAARARTQARSLTPFLEIACRQWCKCSASEAVSITDSAEPSCTSNPDLAFTTWLSRIELVLRSM